MSLSLSEQSVKRVSSFALTSGGASDPTITSGTTDPSSVGFTAPEGSLRLRYVGGAGEIWYKTAAGDTDWTQVGAGIGILTIGSPIVSGTTNRVLYENSSNQLGESANLKFDGTKFTVGDTSSGTPIWGNWGQLNVVEDSPGTESTIILYADNSGDPIEGVVAVTADAMWIGSDSAHSTYLMSNNQAQLEVTSAGNFVMDRNLQEFQCGIVDITNPGGGTPSHYLQAGFGNGAAVSPAGKGRLIYNQSTNKWQISSNGGAYADITTGLGGGSLDDAYNVGSIITADAGAVAIGSTATDSNNILEITKNPAGASSGNGISITLGAAAFGGLLSGTGDWNLGNNPPAAVSIGGDGRALGASTANLLIGLESKPRVAAANTEDWTAAIGLRGFVSQIEGDASASGTITGVAHFHAQQGGAGAGGSTWTNQYGVYVAALGAATNNYGIYIDTPTGTIADAIHVAGGRSYFGGSIAQAGSTSGLLTHAVPATVTSYTLTWPSAQASGTQVLQNDGAGNLSWATNAAGIAVGDAISSGAANRLLYEDGSNQLAESANLTFNGSTLGLGGGTTADMLVIDGTGLSTGDGIQITVDSTLTTGRAIRVLGGASGTTEVFNVDEDGNTYIDGKLTVSGAIDPTSVSITASGSAYYESYDGVSAALSPSGAGRLRYNDTSKSWQMSIDGGAYQDLGTATGNSLNQAYGVGRIISATAGAVEINSAADDTNNVLVLNKSPTSLSYAGNALDITMGANATGAAINITNGGTGPAIDISAGQIQLPSGTAGAPSLAWGASSNYGIFNTGGGTYFTFAGSSKVTFNSSYLAPDPSSGSYGLGDDFNVNYRFNQLYMKGPLDNIPQSGSGTGTPPILCNQDFSLATHTSINNAEMADVMFDLGRVVTWDGVPDTNAVTFPSQRFYRIMKPTMASQAVSVDPESYPYTLHVTDVASLYIEGAPVAGTRTHLDNRYAFWVDDDDVRFDGDLELYGDVTTPLSVLESITTGTDPGQALTILTKDHANLPETYYRQVDLDLGGSGTTDLTWTATTTISEFAGVRLTAPTLKCNSATKNFTTAGTLIIDGPPVQGLNTSIGAQRSLLVKSGDASFGGSIIQEGSSSGTLTHGVPATVTSYSLTWPSAVTGTTGYVLSSDTSGNLSWAANGTSLDGAYDYGGAGVGRTIDVANGAVVLNADQDTTSYALEITREPTASVNTAAGISLLMGSFTTGNGLYVAHEGAGDAINVRLGTTAAAQAIVVADGDTTAFSSAMFSLTRGSNATGDAIYIENAGTGYGLQLLQSGNEEAVWLRQTGTGGALFIDQDGTGNGCYVRQSGSGDALNVYVDSTTLTTQAIYSQMSSSYAYTSAANEFRVLNTSAPCDCVYLYQSGVGYALETLSRQQADGSRFYSDYYDFSSTAVVIDIYRTAGTAYRFLECWGTNGTDRKLYIRGDGAVYSDGSYYNTGADYAESMLVVSNMSTYEPGDVLVVAADDTLDRSASANDSKVAGVYSTNPGVVGNQMMGGYDPSSGTEELASWTMRRVVTETHKTKNYNALVFSGDRTADYPVGIKVGISNVVTEVLSVSYISGPDETEVIIAQSYRTDIWDHPEPPTIRYGMVLRNAIPCAMLGLVPTKCITQNGSIGPGDLLVTSGTVGHAMKASGPKPDAGTILGKSFGSLTDVDGTQTGLVNVYVNIM